MSYKGFRWFASIVITLTISVAGLTPVLAAPPANDNFVDAQAISSLPFSTTVDITDAGDEPQEPQNCYAIANTVWYSFTPTETMLVRAHTQGSAISNSLNVYRAIGPSITDLEFLSCSAYNSGVFLAEAGQTYYIQVGRLFELGTIQVNLYQVLPPANDNFADAAAVTTLPFSASVDITGAGTEAGEPSGCNSRQRTIWYSFTPSETMVIGVDTQGSSIGSAMNLYSASGPGFPGLNLLQCPSPGLALGFVAEAGQTYYLQVGTDEVGTIQVNIYQLFPPPNDDFANAEAITSLPFSTSVDITDARTEQGEPLYSCTVMDRTVWYSFTPTETTVVRVDNQGSSIASNVNIYRAFGPGIGDLNFLSCTATYGPYSFVAEAGQTYYFQAGGMNGEFGTLQINLEQLPPPANDDFSNATVIPSPLPYDSTVNTLTASNEAGEPTSPCAYAGSGNRSVWYAFTPATSGSVSASIPAAAFTPVIAVYTGNSLTSLSQIGCMPYGGNLLTFHVEAGTTYYFQVGNLYPWEQGGSMQFHLDVAPPPVAGFYYYPYDPSVYDTLQFSDGSYDPGSLGFQSFAWDFGDGTTATGSNPTHKFAADGDYTVRHSVTTFDGRTASTSQVVQVRTHDVAITKLSAPKSASTGQTRTITVSVRNSAYAETVQVDLFKSTPGGFVLIGTLTLPVPVSSAGRTTSFSFNYTFISQDAQIGKVTFQAVATILNARDVFPTDNQAFSSPPTKVSR